MAGIKSWVKKFIPKSIITYWRMRGEIRLSCALMNSIEAGNHLHEDFLIGTPIHQNLGDHLIAVAEDALISEYRLEKKFVEISMEMYEAFRPRLEKAIPSDAVIYITGGGWMGDVWPVDEMALQSMLHSFKENKIIIFPQTIFYHKRDEESRSLLESSRKAFAVCKDVTLCVRERNSYDFACENYPGVKVVLTPDVAMFYESYSPQNCKRKDCKKALLCLRSDIEKVDSTEKMACLKKLLDHYGYIAHMTDTIYPKRVLSEDRKKTVNKKLKEFAETGLVVTDRLHGMLFCYLTRTPCIALDNATKKVAGVYDTWLKECNWIFPLFKYKDMLECEQFIQRCVDYNFSFDVSVYKQFKELKRIVRDG